jgi:hemerythrin-like domain-containing protein
VSTAHDRCADIVDLLIHDHREIEEAFARLETDDLTADERRGVANALIATLVRHTVEEEQYLYPAVRRLLTDGDRIADQEIKHHAEARRDLKTLESLKATDPDFDFVLTKLTAAVRQHIMEEEADLFLRVRVAADSGELRDLGRKALSMKKVAPTRPHPSATAQRPVNKLRGPALGLVDRIRAGLRS